MERAQGPADFWNGARPAPSSPLPRPDADPHRPRILVPVHFRDCHAEPVLAADSADAVEEAVDIAAATRGQITFTHVFAQHTRRPGPSDDDELPAVQDTLNELVERAHAHGLPADTVLSFGTPWREIVSLAEDDAFDLLVIGTRQRPGEGAPIGSTAARIASVAPVPTWIARRTSYRPATILAATDLSAGCDRILKRGVTLARNLHHELHIVNAWDRRSRVPPEEPELQIRRAQLEAQMAMATADSGIPPFVSHVEPGDPESVIWRLARRARARVVVLGVNEHTPERMRPDTATEVLTELPCSLLAVRLDR